MQDRKEQIDAMRRRAKSSNQAFRHPSETTKSCSVLEGQKAVKLLISNQGQTHSI